MTGAPWVCHCHFHRFKSKRFFSQQQCSNVVLVDLKGNTGCPHAGFPHDNGSLIDMKMKEGEFKTLAV